jgi:hypothetical protein
VSAPSQRSPGLPGLHNMVRKSGKPDFATGEGWGGASLLLRDARAATTTPTPNPSPQGPHKGEGNRPVVWPRPCITRLFSPRAAPHWQCARARRIRAGRFRPASLPRRGSLHFGSFATRRQAISLSLPTSRLRGKRSWTPAPKSARTLRLRSRTLL